VVLSRLNAQRLEILVLDETFAITVLAVTSIMRNKPLVLQGNFNIHLFRFM
jgi:hypothetical protein